MLTKEGSIPMGSKRSLVLISAVAVALGACTTSAAPSTPPAVAAASIPSLPASVGPVPTSSATASPSSEPDASPSGGAQRTPGSIDPCSLLTADEASQAIGKKLGAGESATLDPDRVCTFKSGLTEVKVILAPPAPDAATAQKYWDMERAKVPAEASVKDLSYFDRSAYGSGSAGGISLSALFVIDGTTFFDFYCGLPACSQDASVAAAQLIVGRLP